MVDPCCKAQTTTRLLRVYGLERKVTCHCLSLQPLAVTLTSICPAATTMGLGRC